MKVAGSPYATQAMGMGPIGRPGAPGPGDTAAMGALADQPQAGGVAVGLAEPPPYPGPADELGEPGPGPRPPRPSRAPRRSGGKGTGMKIAAMAAGAAVVVGGGAVAALALTGGDDGKAKVSASPQADAAKPPPVDPYVEQQQRRKLAYERATRAARQAPGKKPALMPKGKPIPTKKPETEGGGGGTPSLGSPVPKGVAQAYAKSIMDDPGTQFGCLQKLWDKESNWNYRASNPSSGAYGIPQALPGSKMASAGDDWRTNYKTQIRWGLGYIDNRYGTPCKAWAHSQSVGWY
ncbi:lytic transglycosylase domain-containing protein [Spirillospora sp. CA-255316]